MNFSLQWNWRRCTVGVAWGEYDEDNVGPHRTRIVRHRHYFRVEIGPFALVWQTMGVMEIREKGE